MLQIPIGAPDEVLHRLPEFIREFSSSPILPDLIWWLQPELASKTPEVEK